MTDTSPDLTVSTGSDILVYGTKIPNHILLESDAKAELINFPGQNIIQIQSSCKLFTVLRSGNVTIFKGSDGTILKIPATVSAQTISFIDKNPLVLNIYDSQVKLDDQIIGTQEISVYHNN